MPELAAIQRPTKTPDDAGGQTLAWVDVHTDVPCRISTFNRMPKEMEIADRLATANLWILYMPADTDVRNTDRIIVIGRTFEVKAVTSAGSWAGEARVVTTEII